MTILYKFTSNGWSRRDTRWEVGKTHRKERQCEDPQLCSSDVFHAYDDLNFGLVINPTHNTISEEHLVIFECEGEIVVRDWSKVGVFEITALRVMELPAWYADKTTRKRVLLALSDIIENTVPDVVFWSIHSDLEYARQEWDTPENTQEAINALELRFIQDSIAEHIDYNRYSVKNILPELIEKAIAKVMEGENNV